MIATRWFLKRAEEHPAIPLLHVQELGHNHRGICMPVVSRSEARAVLPYLRGELEERIRRADAPAGRAYDPALPT